MNRIFYLGFSFHVPDPEIWYMGTGLVDLPASTSLTVSPTEYPESGAIVEVSFVIEGEGPPKGEEPIFELFSCLINPAKALEACLLAMRECSGHGEEAVMVAPVLRKTTPGEGA